MTQYAFRLSQALFLKDPLASEVGRTLIKEGAPLFLEQGLEGFTVKKLAARAGTTEATVYKYFQNKQRLLQYYFQLYWTWLEQQIKVFTTVIEDPREKLRQSVRLICDIPSVAADPGLVTKEDLHALVVAEGFKAFLHAKVDADNEKKLFAPYKQLVNYLAALIREADPSHKYPVAFATTLVEMAHSLEFYREHLPSLTDFPQAKTAAELEGYLQHLIDQQLNQN